MHDRMSLFTLLNPNDVDSARSTSARSTPDPATPASITSIPEAWTPATRLSSLHRRNESFESATSSSSLQQDSGRDQIRFPPFNDLDATSRQLASRYNVEPLGAIVPCPRPVSYNSDKRALKAKIGISKFQVFEYSFQLEGEDKKWCVMWDYRLGLVRFTPFFKCLGYSKTAPARMVKANPGLEEIKYNITGGTIHAQGYWIPYQCARELATKFCYSIAGALIPIFGPDFPRDCLSPTNPAFEDMIISQETIRASTMDLIRIRDRMRRSRLATSSPAITSHPQTPDEPSSTASASGERPRMEGRWSEPPGTSLETQSQSSSQHAHWGSRPGTQDGSSLASYMASPRPTPVWPSSSYTSPHGDALPVPRDDLLLPPLRNHLQRMASQVLSIRPSTFDQRVRDDLDMSNVDPRLRSVDDEVSYFHGESNQIDLLQCRDRSEVLSRARAGPLPDPRRH